MDFIKSVKDGVTKTANKAMKASNEVIEITKLNFSISDLQNDIEKAYKKIGEMAYHAYHDNTEESDISELCSEIDEKYSQIEEHKARLRELKKIKVCQNCGSENLSENKFCKDCGAEIVQDGTKEE